MNIRIYSGYGAVAAILAVAVGGWLLVKTPQAADSSSVRRGEPTPYAAQKSESNTSVKEATPAAPIARAKESQPESMLGIYNSDSNIRPLIARALQHPEKGGAFYARQMLSECSGVVRGTDVLENAQLPYEAGQSDYAQRAEAVKRLSRRCSGLLPDEISYSRDREIASQGAKQGDPLFLANKAYNAATAGSAITAGFRDAKENAPARRAAVTQILATQDPLLIDDLGMALSLYVDASTSRKYFWFAGTSYSIDSDFEVGGALYLLPCGLGMVCDATEFETLSRCASGEGCDASRFEYLRRTYQSRPGVYENMIGLYGKMLEAVRARDVGAFVQ